MYKRQNYVHAEMSDIQIMTPMRKGALGVEALNKQLQEKFNPPAPNKQDVYKRQEPYCQRVCNPKF